MPASRARARPGAAARLEMTTAIAASSRRFAIASMIDWRLLPRPEISTAMYGGRVGDGSAYGDRASLPGTGIADEVAHPMPRRARGTTGGFAYHVLNRAVRRANLFESPFDYLEFERLIWQALRRVPVLLLAYCALPNHWHLVLSCPGDTDLPRFLHWPTLQHAQWWHLQPGTGGTGPVYQGRYKAIRI